MKWLVFNPAGGLYGSEQSMLALLSARREGSVLVCPPEGELTQEAKSRGISVRPLEFLRKPFFKTPISTLAFLAKIAVIILDERPDVVVVNLDGSTPSITIVAFVMGVRIVRFCRFEVGARLRRIDRWSWERTVLAICPSERVALQLRAALDRGRPAIVAYAYDPIAIWPADPANAKAFREAWNGKDRTLIGVVGRIHPGKRIEVAIRAAAVLLDRGWDIRLVVMGGDDGSVLGKSYTHRLRAIADSLGVLGAVEFTGPLRAEMMPAAMAAIDLCVLPSESESFGMVLAEAWAQGVPTLASDVGGCSEITLASGGGLLAPVGDVAGFADQMVYLLQNVEIARAMGACARQWVVENCDPPSYAEKVGKLIDGAI